MKKRTRRGAGKEGQETIGTLSRSEALLAQILLHSMGSAGQEKKAMTLRAAGLANIEIAELLGTTKAVVGQVLYQGRQRRGARGRTRTAARRRK